MSKVQLKESDDKVMTEILIKILVSLGVIVAVTAIAKKLPSIAGLISVMPLTGAMILVWVYLENKDDLDS